MRICEFSNTLVARVARPVGVWARAFVLGLASFGLQAAEAGPTVDELLELKAAQAESLDALDAEIESTVSGEDGVTKTTRARIAFDKVDGWTRMQKLDSDDNVAMDIKTEGTEVSFLQANGQWKTVALDPQTQATLREMGVDFGDELEAGAGPAAKAVAKPNAAQRKQRGLGGHGKLPKDKAQRRAAKRLRMQKQIQRLKQRHRVERRGDLDQDRPSAMVNAADLEAPLALETEGLLDAGNTPTARQARRARKAKLRALWQRRQTQKTAAQAPAASDAGSPDAMLEMVDEDSGVVVETSHFVRAERVQDMVDLSGQGGELDVTEIAPKRGDKAYAGLKGKQHPFKTKKRKLPQWARRLKDDDGSELVEVQRTRVLKLKRVGDTLQPEETEQVDVTGVGEVKQRVKWKHKEQNNAPYNTAR
jgi:hypothetical protein